MRFNLYLYYNKNKRFEQIKNPCLNKEFLFIFDLKFYIMPIPSMSPP